MDEPFVTGFWVGLGVLAALAAASVAVVAIVGVASAIGTVIYRSGTRER